MKSKSFLFKNNLNKLKTNQILKFTIDQSKNNQIVSFLYPVSRTKIVDTTGAGDAFNGSLAFGLSKEKPIKECLELANKVAGISTTKLGAGDAMPFISDIQ